MNTLIINTDGGSRGNPGPAATGVAVTGDDWQFCHNRCLGETTNNVAEYSAVVDALEILPGLIEAHGTPDYIEFRMDSQLVQRQLSGIYKIKEPALQVLASQVRTKLQSLAAPYSFIYVPRAQNKLADMLVNEALDAQL